MEYKAEEPVRAFQFGRYLDDSLLKPRHFYKTGLEETLEGVVAEKAPASEEGFLERVLEQKALGFKASVKALFNELTAREKLNADISSQISEEICRTGSYLEEIRLLTRNDYSNYWASKFTGRRTQLEDRTIGLARELREEARANFREQSQLRLYLLKALKDYAEFSRKMKHLGYGEDVAGQE